MTFEKIVIDGINHLTEKVDKISESLSNRPCETHELRIKTMEKRVEEIKANRITMLGFFLGVPTTVLAAVNLWLIWHK